MHFFRSTVIVPSPRDYFRGGIRVVIVLDKEEERNGIGNFSFSLNCYVEFLDIDFFPFFLIRT